MEREQLARHLIASLRPLVRQTAHQLTLMGLVQDSHEFSQKYLSSYDAYDHLAGLSLMELAVSVHAMEFGLGLQECLYQHEWDEAVTDRERWQSRVRLSAIRLQLVRLRRWKREHNWQTLPLN